MVDMTSCENALYIFSLKLAKAQMDVKFLHI